MAFDHDDTDALYNRQIRPVLRRNGVTPVIINRRHSNDDLNHQIIEQLNACDFAIADLTYARQSVYFEAGYAQRAVPVVYTVRSDHLKRGPVEDRRVHFDLQMKPLIRWSGPADPTFPRRLERRLRATILRDWRRRRTAKDEIEKDRDAFRALPMSERLVALRRCAIAALRRVGFGSWEYHQRPDYVHRTYADIAQSPGTITGTRRRGGDLTIVSIRALPALGKKELAELRQRTSPYAPHRLDDEHLSTWPPRVTVHNLAFTLRPVSRDQLEATLDLGCGQRPGQYVRQETTDVPHALGARGRVTFRATVNYVDAVKSEPEFRDALRVLVADLFLGDGRRAARQSRPRSSK